MGFFELFSTGLAGFYALVPSYGLAIILLTVAVRLLLLPLSIKQTRSMREMQRIQPEVKKIQTKYKGDRQKMNEELMGLYKEHGVNPFGGCLPVLMQFPVLIALYYVVRFPLKYMGDAVAGSALADALRINPLDLNQFLGIRLDCSSQLVIKGVGSDTVEVACGTGLISSLPYLVLVLAMGYTTYYQQKQMQKVTPTAGGDSPQAQQMQIMGKVMPLVLMVFSFTFPSGVVLYWLTTNLWTIAQQRMVLSRVAPAAGAEVDAGKNGGKTAAPQVAKAAEATGGGASPNGGKATTKASSSKKKKKKR